MSINDFSESASSKFLFEMLDGRNGALQEIRCSVTHVEWNRSAGNRLVLKVDGETSVAKRKEAIVVTTGNAGEHLLL